jgi:hypothetical protein
MKVQKSRPEQLITPPNTESAPDFPVGEAAAPVAVLEGVELDEPSPDRVLSKVKEAETLLALVHAEGNEGTTPATKFTAAHYSLTSAVIIDGKQYLT